MRMPADFVVVLSAFLIVLSNNLPSVLVRSHDGTTGAVPLGTSTMPLLVALTGGCIFVMLVLLGTLFYRRRLPSILAALVIAVGGFDAAFLGWRLLRTFHGIAALGLPAVCGPATYLLIVGGACGMVGAALELPRAWETSAP